MTNPPWPETRKALIAAATALATGCTVRLEDAELSLQRGDRVVFRVGMHHDHGLWSWLEHCPLGDVRRGLSYWPELCDKLRRFAATALPTGYDPFTLSQVLRAAVDFGEATRAGDHGKAATALEVIRGHEALVRAGEPKESDRMDDDARDEQEPQRLRAHRMPGTFDDDWSMGVAFGRRSV